MNPEKIYEKTSDFVKERKFSGFYRWHFVKLRRKTRARRVPTYERESAQDLEQRDESRRRNDREPIFAEEGQERQI